MECQEHKAEITLVCVTCDHKKLCLQCFDDHTKLHDIQSLGKVTNRKKQQLNDLSASYTQHLSDIHLDIQDIQAQWKEQDFMERQVCDKITAQRQLLHKAINKSADKLVKICKQQKQKNLTALQDRKNVLSLQCTEITNNQSEIKKALQSHDLSEIIKAAETFKPMKNIAPTLFVSFDFHTSQINEQGIDTTLGQMAGTPADDDVSDCLGSLHLQTPVSLSTSQNAGSDFVGSGRSEGVLTTVSTISSNTSDYTEVIHPSVPGYAWIKWYRQNDIQLVDSQGQVIQTVKFNQQIIEITTTPDNRLLVSGYVEKCIYQVFYGSEPSVYFKTKLHPRYICTTDSGDVFVSMVDSADFTTTQNSRRTVGRYNSKGQHVSESTEFDIFGGRLFVIPCRLSVNNNNTAVAVANLTSENPHSSHLVLLDTSLNFKLRYDGKVTPANKKYKPNTDVKFFFQNVTFTPENNILVTEGYNRSILLLDSDCQLLKTLWRDELEPVSLCIHNDGKLWCGFANKGGGVIKVFKPSTRGQKINQMNKRVQSSAAGNFLPQAGQPQQNIFGSTQTQKLGPSSKWGTAGRQLNPHAKVFQFMYMPGAHIGPSRPSSQMNARPTTERTSTGGYKFNTQMESHPQGIQKNPLIPQQYILTKDQEPLTPSTLASVPPQKQKQMLGECLFPLIARNFPDLAGKLTGMLLELDNLEILHILEHQASLDARMQEAVAALKAHQAKESAN